MREIFQHGKYLFVVCFAAGLLLVAANRITADKIEEQEKKKIGESVYAEVMPAAKKFVKKDGFVEACDARMRIVGYVLEVSTPGYISNVKAVVGIDKKFAITGIKIFSQYETPGYGTKMMDEKYQSQYLGKSGSEIMLKQDGGEIDGVTGATISSKAITDAVRAKINEFKAKQK